MIIEAANIPVSPCPNCGDAARDKSVNDPDFVRCARCGLLHSLYKKDRVELQKLLDDRLGRIDFSKLKPVLDCRGAEPELELLSGRCRELFKDGEALDVGTALGDFVSCLTCQGMRASGLEPSHGHAEIARSYGLDVRDGRFNATTIEILFGDRRFDLVSFRESLYYIDDHRHALELVRRILTDRGILYIKAHVADSPYYWGGVRLVTRLGSNATVFFSRATLLGMLQNHGFSILATKSLHLSSTHALEAWKLSPRLRTLVEPLLPRVMHFMPPDRFLVLAKPVA